MYFRAIATDYDGTLAHERAVSPATLAALENCKKDGRRLILVTGRQVESLRAVFRHYGVFDRIVAENGAPSLQSRDGGRTPHRRRAPRKLH